MDRVGHNTSCGLKLLHQVRHQSPWLRLPSLGGIQNEEIMEISEKMYTYF